MTNETGSLKHYISDRMEVDMKEFTLSINADPMNECSSYHSAILSMDGRIDFE